MDSLILLFSLVALTSCVAGFLSGVLGIGGGAIIVPVLYYVFISLGFSLDSALHSAIGTSLATIIFTQTRSGLGHLKRGAFHIGIFRVWALPIIVGALSGGLLASLVAGRVLAFVFAISLFLVALVMIYRAQLDLHKVDRSRLVAPQAAEPIKIKVYPIAFLSGMFSAITGIGGGTFNVSALNLIFHRNIKEAIGTSSGLGALIGLCGTFVFIIMGLGQADRIPYSLGFVNLPSVLLIIPFTLACAPLGVQVAHQLPQKQLQILFAFMLILASGNMLYEGMQVV